MTKYLFPALVIAGLIFAVSVEARPPSTSCSAAGCFSDDNGDLRMDPSAADSSLEAEWCLTVSSAALPASKYLDGAKSLYAENRSSANAFLRFDAAAVTTTGASGMRWTAGAERAIDLSGRTFGPRITGASTANMTTPACFWLLWLR